MPFIFRLILSICLLVSCIGGASCILGIIAGDPITSIVGFMVAFGFGVSVALLKGMEKEKMEDIENR